MTVIESPEHRMGGEIYYREEKYSHDPELREAYECGRKQGWREAMMEAERGGYHERRDWREMPPMMREHDRYAGDRPDYRDDFREPYPDEIEYRRRRAANGRYM